MTQRSGKSLDTIFHLHVPKKVTTSGTRKSSDFVAIGDTHKIQPYSLAFPEIPYRKEPFAKMHHSLHEGPYDPSHHGAPLKPVRLVLSPKPCGTSILG